MQQYNSIARFRFITGDDVFLNSNFYSAFYFSALMASFWCCCLLLYSHDYHFARPTGFIVALPHVLSFIRVA